MIKFFRHIRKQLLTENNFSKYLIYAIGEIVLVVIGILIALQINNKNESRKAMVKERVVIINLVQDLKSDSISYSRNYKTLTDINVLHENLYKIGIKNRSDIILENPNNIRRTLYYNPITIKNDPFVANKISNDAIRKEIMNYSRFMKDLDDTYGEFEKVIHDRMRVFLGKKEVHSLSGWFENQDLDKNSGISEDIISQKDLILLAKTKEFQQLLLEASIKLRETLFTLEVLITQNNTLKHTIQKEYQIN